MQKHLPNDESVIGMEKLRKFDVKQLNIVNITPELLKDFAHYQKITKKWVKRDNVWELTDVSLLREWSEAKSNFFVRDPKRCYAPFDPRHARISTAFSPCHSERAKRVELHSSTERSDGGISGRTSLRMTRTKKHRASRRWDLGQKGEQCITFTYSQTKLMLLCILALRTI